MLELELQDIQVSNLVAKHIYISIGSNIKFFRILKNSNFKFVGVCSIAIVAFGNCYFQHKFLFFDAM